MPAASHALPVPPPRLCFCRGGRPSQAAVASALGEDVAQVGQLSPQDLYYCGDAKRDCLTGASLKDTLAELAKRQLLLEKCLPYQQPKDVSIAATKQQLCAKSCADTSPLASKGFFTYLRITEVWKAQQHIRQYGAVVSRIMCMQPCMGVAW
jgi:hypothetical protein